MKYGTLNLGQIEAIVNKLGGMEGVQRFLSDEIVVKTAEKTFTIWKTITLGLHNDADSYSAAIKKLGFNTSDWVNDILGKSAFAGALAKEAIDLVVVSVADLGFKNSASYKEICDTALTQGLSLVPAEVGPVLRVEYKDQPKREWLRIAMKSIANSDGNPFIFDVAHDAHDVWLNARNVHPGDKWSIDNRFVFCLRK